MKCIACGEFIYKGRKFNARKETTDETYYAIKIYRFYIRCTRCSAEITFKTDPRHSKLRTPWNDFGELSRSKAQRLHTIFPIVDHVHWLTKTKVDYECERGAKRNFEPWREEKLNQETDEERLDRLEREEAERDAMTELETKTLDAKTEMAIADALDEIRTRNARIERGEFTAEAKVEKDPRDAERERQEKEDEEAARRAFETASGERVRRFDETAAADVPEASSSSASAADAIAMPPPSFKRTAKKKKDFGAALGIKKKQSLV